MLGLHIEEQCSKETFHLSINKCLVLYALMMVKSTDSVVMLFRFPVLSLNLGDLEQVTSLQKNTKKQKQHVIVLSLLDC